ncbi:MAG: hypothetical protein JXA25_08900 [Anaerolineales bacterium]|nr:hypothetical protein [Anaerolineales bacterium]
MNSIVLFTTDRGESHQQAALEAAPPEMEVRMLRAPGRAALKEALADVSFLISERSGVIDRDVIAGATNLKLIQRLGSLTFDIDLESAAEAGIAVCYWPVENVIRVAEHIVMQMLALTKRLLEVERITLEASPDWGESRRTDEDTFAYNWSGRSGIGQLWQRTVGIIGMGEIGVELARRLQGFGCEVLYNKRTPLPVHVEKELGLTYAESADLFTRSDFLVNLLPYSKETDMLLDEAKFKQMKQGAFVVSCGSGSILDEAALAETIREGKLAGAALDTFEWEPVRADQPLLALAKEGYNVLLTPHTAAGTPPENQSEPARARDYINIRRYLAGQELLYRLV